MIADNAETPTCSLDRLDLVLSEARMVFDKQLESVAVLEAKAISLLGTASTVVTIAIGVLAVLYSGDLLSHARSLVVLRLGILLLVASGTLYLVTAYCFIKAYNIVGYELPLSTKPDDLDGYLDLSFEDLRIQLLTNYADRSAKCRAVLASKSGHLRCGLRWFAADMFVSVLSLVAFMAA